MKKIYTNRGKVRFFLAFIGLFVFQTVLLAQNNTLVTIKKDNISVVEALQEVEKQTKMFVAYNESQLKSQKNIDLDIENGQPEQVLAQILAGTGFTYQLRDDYIVIVPVTVEQGVLQKKQVRGEDHRCTRRNRYRCESDRGGHHEWHGYRRERGFFVGS